MPICKNDPKKSYKGTEPSPKGLGYCAHAEKLETIKKGLDGNNWKIESTAQGVKRWVKQSSKSSSKKYFIYHPSVVNIPYLVYVNENKKTASIYTLPIDKKSINIPSHPSDSNAKKDKTTWAYTIFIKEYKYKKIYIGSSNGKSKRSDHYKIKNNGLLLELEPKSFLSSIFNFSKNNYVFIGEVGIMEFHLDDKILKLLTPVGYPVIYGEKNVYHLYEGRFIEVISRNNLPNKMNDSEIEDTFYKNDKIVSSSISVKRI